MNTLAERVLEAIKATGLDVPTLAKKVGVSKQAVYDWKKGVSLTNIKGENLVELADLAGYEPLWIMKGKGLKKKTLTPGQEKLLLAMQKGTVDQQNLIFDIVDSVLKHKIESVSQPQRLGDEKRQRENHFDTERRKTPWTYNKGGS